MVVKLKQKYPGKVKKCKIDLKKWLDLAPKSKDPEIVEKELRDWSKEGRTRREVNIMSEEILGIFPSFIEKGHHKRGITFKFRGQICKLFFTTNRLIVAKDEHRRGHVFFKPEVYYNAFRASARERLQMKDASMSILEGILKTSICEIPYSEISVVEFQKPRFDNLYLCVFTKDLNVPIYTFTVAQPNWDRYITEFKEFLHMVLPDKV